MGKWGSVQGMHCKTTVRQLLSEALLGKDIAAST